jgi:isopenicillin N synthase-like dioxygenase
MSTGRDVKERRMPQSSGIPTIDLGPWLSGDPQARARAAEQVDEALSRAGFLLVTGHGVTRASRQAVREAARTFFALPVPTKERYAVSVGGRGWLAKGAEANGYAEGTETA